MSDIQGGAYREGIQALLDVYDARCRRVAERAAALDAAARAELLPAQAHDLAAAEAQIARSPSTREELEAAEGVLDGYEKQVDVALAVVAELHDKRAAAARERRRRRRHVVMAAVALGTVGVGLLAWGRYADREAVAHRQEVQSAACRHRPACATSGLCGAPLRETRGTTLDCIASSDADCTASAECKSHGTCTEDNGACRALTREDCKSSDGCRVRGECSPDQGVCRRLVSADCAQTELCLREGKCGIDRGNCRALTNEGCAGSTGCRERGACSASYGECRALTDADCKRSRGCAEHGACTARDEICTLTNEECGVRPECKINGRCFGDGTTCSATDPFDCGSHGHGCRR
jgi:hypothetical protein